MVKKRALIISIVIITLLAYLVLAVGEGVKIISPAPGSNYTTITGILFNVSFINESDITSPANASFFINLSGTWTKIGNTSASGGCNINSCSATITNLTIPDGIYSLNATIYNSTGSASTSITSLENLSSMIYIDNTPPIVFTENITHPLSGSNYSQTIRLNVSAIDSTIGIQTVIFNITNSSGQQNATASATREGSTSNYATTIDTSQYPDGYYNITVYATDSLSNLNNTARVFRIIFDNSGPSFTYSCDDYDVDEDDVITCTCSASDALVGVNTSYGTGGVSFTSKPSTSSSGKNLQTTCTSQDNVGNTNTSTLYYNVTGASSSNRGSGSGSGNSNSQKNNSTNNSTNSNSTSQDSNNTSKDPNELKGNQDNLINQFKLNINYWILTGVILGAGAVVATVVLIRKKLQRVLNSKTSRSFKK